MIHGQTEAEAEREHEEIVRALGLGEVERISVGYVDLLNHVENLSGT